MYAHVCSDFIRAYAQTLVCIGRVFLPSKHPNARGKSENEAALMFVLSSADSDERYFVVEIFFFRVLA